MSFFKRLDKIPLGHSFSWYKGKKYSISKTSFNAGRTIKFFAQDLAGNDFISANFYRLKQQEILKPCEMPEQKVLDFLEHHQPVLNIGLGTAAIGRPLYINIRQEKSESFDLERFKNSGLKTIDEAYQQGIRYFDTAPGYGLAEQLIIDWIQSKKDPSIEVATKWGYTYTAQFNPNARQHEVKEHSIEKLNEQWEVSKQLLPFLKIYQIHSATFESKALDNQAVLERLAQIKKEHNILIGITTSGQHQIEVIQKAMGIQFENTDLFEAFQVTYNMLDQSLVELLPQLKARNKKIIVKEALANGRIFRNDKYPHYNQLYNYLDQLSKKYKVGPDAIALRFCIDSISPFKVLSGAAISAHLNQNLKAEQFILNAQEIEILKSFKMRPSDYWSERKKLTWQ